MKDNKLAYKLIIKELKTGFVRVRNVSITNEQFQHWSNRLDVVSDTGFVLLEIRADYND